MTAHPAELLHPCLREPGAELSAPLAPLAEAPRTDRQRLGLLLEGVALLAHLALARWHLPDGWSASGVTAEGRLLAGSAAPGTASTLPQHRALELLHRLFLPGEGRRVAGRGVARRAARALERRWRPGLAAVHPDRLVALLLEEAPFLWDDDLAGHRRALAGEHRRDGAAWPWVAGPGPFRWRLLHVVAAEGVDPADLLASERARGLHRGPVPQGSPEELAAEGRHRAALVAWDARPPRTPAAARSFARSLLHRGRAERALQALDGDDSAAGLLLAARAHLQLGEVRSALRTVGRADDGDLGPEERLELAEVEVWARSNAGAATAGLERARQVVGELEGAAAPLLGRAHLLAAGASWDAGEREALERHLAAAVEPEDAREALEAEPERAAALAQVRALAELDRGEPGAAVAVLEPALARHRRRLARPRAAALWNDLGLARARRGDLAGAEKAFSRGLGLYRRCDGARVTTLGLANLAEVRLRRGRLAGVEEILERIAAADRAAGNVRGETYGLLLWGRCELVHGRAGVARSLLRRAQERCRRHDLMEPLAEARLLEARALGWLGRGEEAAVALEEGGGSMESGGRGLDRLEAEERPALFALAGRRDEALAAAGRFAAVWEPVLTGRPVPPEAWGALDGLSPFRAARAALDLELVRPGVVPSARRRRSIAALRRCGAVRLAERLEAREEGMWSVVARYLEGGDGSPEALTSLLLDCGYPAARIWWESEVDARVLVDSPGGEEERSAPCRGGRLVLRAPSVDAPLAALLQLVRRRLEGPTGTDPLADGAAGAARRRERGAPRHGIVGDSPALRRAVERAEALAAGEMAVLVLGESGTGKELVARAIHRASPRAEGPWVTVNCAALSETLILSDLFGHVRGAFTGADRDRAGVFETAGGGTVFLDEIGDLPATAQGMMLRVLQEGEVRRVGESLPRRVDVRVVAATHRDLDAMVREGSFRRDLYYRLKGAAVALPPLRERGRDVLRLADHLLARTGGDAGPPPLAEEARARLLAHSWPGNVRELENVLAVAATLAAADGGAIGPEHLELPSGDGAPDARPAGYHQQVEAYRRRLVVDALAATDGNQAAAARRLGLTRQALSYLVRSLEIDVSALGSP